MSDREVEAVARAFDMGFAWRGMLQGQNLEDARAVVRTLAADIFDGLAIGSINVLATDPAEDAIVAAKRAIKHALATLPAEPARVSGGIDALKAKWQGGTLYDVGTIRSAIDQAAAIVASELEALVGALAQNMRNLAETERGFGKDEAAWAYWRCANLLTQALAASRPPETARAEG